MDTDTKTTKPDVADPHPEKYRMIRNREVDKAAKILAEDHILPEVPGSKLSWTQMEEYLALLTPAMWSHVNVYVYRLNLWGGWTRRAGSRPPYASK